MTIIPYIPGDPHVWKRTLKLPDVHSTWKGLERLFPELLVRFSIAPHNALEFGVWYGYSTAVLANFFRNVTGVDTFKGDAHAGFRDDLRDGAEQALFPFSNVALIESSWEDYTANCTYNYDLIHVDVSHEYATTRVLGGWAIVRAPVVLFHDTEAFPDVKQACSDIADATHCDFYNYPECCGLGILVRR